MHSLPAITLAVICLSGAAATSGTVVEHVDCAAVAGSHTTAIQATLASINESCSSYTALGGPAPDALIRISGPCLLDRSIRVYGRHACRSISLQGNTPSELLSGGLPVYASWFAPVTDAGILSQITSPAARSAVVELNLTEHAITNLGRGPGPISGRGCRAYAEGLPEPHGGSMPGASINSPPGLELFAWAGKGTLPAPLTLARWPNYPWQPQNWSTVSSRRSVRLRCRHAHAPPPPAGRPHVLWASQPHFQSRQCNGTQALGMAAAARADPWINQCPWLEQVAGLSSASES